MEVPCAQNALPDIGMVSFKWPVTRGVGDAPKLNTRVALAVDTVIELELKVFDVVIFINEKHLLFLCTDSTDGAVRNRPVTGAFIWHWGPAVQSLSAE